MCSQVARPSPCGSSLTKPVESVAIATAYAPLKKPHPQVYRQVLDATGLAPQACLAFEDSFNGLRSASGAGIATIVTPTHFTAQHDFTGALRVLDDLAGVGFADLLAWHEEKMEQAL